jgi:hypothetical protein
VGGLWKLEELAIARRAFLPRAAPGQPEVKTKESNNPELERHCLYNCHSIAGGPHCTAD